MPRVAQPGKDGGKNRRPREPGGLARTPAGRGIMNGANGLGRGRASWKGQPLLIDELPFDRNRGKDPERGDQRKPRDHPNRIGAHGRDHQQRAEGRHVAATRHIARTGSHSGQRIVLEDPEGFFHQSGGLQELENAETQNTGGECDAHAPTGLEENVEVGEAHRPADQHAHDHRPHREVGRAGPVGFGEPFGFAIRGGRSGRGRISFSGGCGHG